VLRNPSRPGDVVFRPRRAAFAIEISGLPPNASGVAVYDAQGTRLAELAVSTSGTAAHPFPAAEQRPATPWRLHLPAQQATIQIDGLTRWEDGDQPPNIACWTTEVAAWFPLLDYRWLLTPYQRLVYGQPGTKGETALRVRNDSDRRQQFSLAVEFPESAWPVRVAPEEIELAPGRSAKLPIEYPVPDAGQRRLCHVRVTPRQSPDYSTYSTIEVRAGSAPAAQPLSMPLVLQPYAHENEQFGYLPDYPLESQFYFDLHNRPLTWTGRNLAIFDGANWHSADLSQAIRSETGTELGPCSPVGSKIAADSRGYLHTLAGTHGQPFVYARLLAANDAGSGWTPPEPTGPGLRSTASAGCGCRTTTGRSTGSIATICPAIAARCCCRPTGAKPGNSRAAKISPRPDLPHNTNLGSRVGRNVRSCAMNGPSPPQAARPVL
jgi:hypothetical protein